MALGILGRKVGMTQIFDDNGALVPVTVIDTTDCMISQVKTQDKDGYQALQVAVGNRKPQNVNKATAGHFKKAGMAAKSQRQEFRLDSTADLTAFKAGQALNVGMFQKGDKVDVVGTSKGRGTQGVVKRWGFHGADATHGVSDYFRHGGSNGANTFPGKVIKNKGMPGRMGDVRTTTLNLKVLEVKEAENLLLVKGAVPGHINSWVMVRPTNRKVAPTGRTFVKA
ncbi:MAG: 50S ribosomal protein L3 [Proteobacteria bacterium]|nr:50S ribosomal protein L3 [Pseudomonadota bacterium]